MAGSAKLGLGLDVWWVQRRRMRPVSMLGHKGFLWEKIQILQNDAHDKFSKSFIHPIAFRMLYFTS